MEAGEGRPAEHREWEEDVRIPEAVRVEEHHGNQPQQEAGEQVIFLFLEVAIDEAGQRHQPDEQVHGDATRAATLIEAERLVVHEDLDPPRQPEEVGADQHDQYLLEHLAPVYRVDQQAERDQVSKGQVAVEREREQKSRGDLPVSVDRHEYQRRQDQDQRGGALDGRVPEQQVAGGQQNHGIERGPAREHLAHPVGAREQQQGEGREGHQPGGGRGREAQPGERVHDHVKERRIELRPARRGELPERVKGDAAGSGVTRGHGHVVARVHVDRELAPVGERQGHHGDDQREREPVEHVWSSQRASYPCHLLHALSEYRTRLDASARVIASSPGSRPAARESSRR